MIATAINAGELKDFSDDAAGGLFVAIDSGISMNCADKFISDHAADGLVSTPINGDELIATPIDSTYCADTNVLDDVVYVLMMLMR